MSRRVFTVIDPPPGGTITIRGVPGPTESNRYTHVEPGLVTCEGLVE
ncbi:MAG: hypothetical protein ACJ77A_14945 [Actinomycetota bacterium]